MTPVISAYRRKVWLMKAPVVYVVGDYILDVTVRRQKFKRTQEDPTVLVLPWMMDNSSWSWVPGGAANLALNLQKMGCKVSLFSHPTGPEPFLNSGVTPVDPVTRKIRYYEGDRLVARVDDDVTSVPVKVPYSLPAPDALVLSDYGKGALTKESVESWTNQFPTVPLFVDPHPSNLDLWKTDQTDPVVRGHLCMNWSEAYQSSCFRTEPDPANDDQAVDLLAEILHVYETFETITIKRGRFGSITSVNPAADPHDAWHGLYLPAGGLQTTKDGSKVILTPPVAPRAVYDVQGAGDTYLAGLVTASCKHANIIHATLFASAAAGIAVGKPGTSTVETVEVVKALKPIIGYPSGVMTAEAAYRLADTLRAMGFKIGLTSGCFDLRPHAGHRRVIREAADRCDFLFVGLDSDERVRKLKGADRPAVGQDERASLVASLAGVGAAFVFHTGPEGMILGIKPDVYVKSKDYTASNVPEAQQLSAWGGRLVIADSVDCLSTTDLLARIRKDG